LTCAAKPARCRPPFPDNASAPTLWGGLSGTVRPCQDQVSKRLTARSRIDVDVEIAQFIVIAYFDAADVRHCA
jgi:hypothetical protein